MTQNYFSKMQCLRSKLLAWSKFYNKLMYKTLYFSLSHTAKSHIQEWSKEQSFLFTIPVCAPPPPPTHSYGHCHRTSLFKFQLPCFRAPFSIPNSFLSSCLTSLYIPYMVLTWSNFIYQISDSTFSKSVTWIVNRFFFLQIF